MEVSLTTGKNADIILKEVTTSYIEKKLHSILVCKVLQLLTVDITSKHFCYYQLENIEINKKVIKLQS